MKVDSQTNALFAALSTRHATKSAASASGAAGSASASAEAGDAASGVSEFDFASMTPREMQGAAKKLFKTGDIDLTQLFMLQNMGVPLGKMGSQGEFLPLSAEEKEGFLSRPVDYLEATGNAISALEQTGYASNPKSGYEEWKNLLATLAWRQGAARLDVTV